MRFKLAAVFAALFVSFGASAASAQPQTASGFWASPYSRTPEQQIIDDNRARTQEQARQGGFGAGYSVTNYNGTVNVTSTHNGDSISSGSTNIGQSNSTTSTLSGSNLNLTVTTGQNMGDANQRAGSQAAVIGVGTQRGACQQGPCN